MRYRGDGSPRSTSSITPERGRRSVDSDSATTCLPTSKAMAIPSAFVLREDSSPRLAFIVTPATPDRSALPARVIGGSSTAYVKAYPGLPSQVCPVDVAVEGAESDDGYRELCAME